MRIEQVTVTHGELRSRGCPDYSNKRYEITYSAEVEEGEDWRAVRRDLMEQAIAEVRMLHGDELEGGKVSIVAVKRVEELHSVPF